VSSERRDRFLKLERPRQAGVPSTSTDRFRPPPERLLETADPQEGAQPFTRCASCQMDNTVYAPACQHCGAALDTPAQRDFNERLWASRKTEAEAERRASADREQERQREAAAQARQRRELAEELARQEKDRIEEQYGDGPGGPGLASGSAGMRLLRLVPGAGWRIVLAVFAIGIPLLLLLFGRGRLQFAGMALLGILIALFSPGRRRSRRW